jgi:hypothetical protein
VTRGAVALLGFLVLLKTFQRLGYFVPISQVPAVIVEHLVRVTRSEAALADLPGYDLSGTRFRHLSVIREHLQVRACDSAARHLMLQAMHEAARTKEHLADLLNVGIETLVRQRYELPAFDTLARGARHVRAALYRQFYRQAAGALTVEEKTALAKLFVPEAESRFTPWNQLKQEPSNPTLTHLRRWLERQVWLAQYRVRSEILAGIPGVKVKHFAAEARTLDAARMLAVEPEKRFILAVSLLTVQAATLLDDLAEMLLKRMAAIHQRGREALETYRATHRQRTDELVHTLRDLVNGEHRQPPGGARGTGDDSGERRGGGAAARRNRDQREGTGRGLLSRQRSAPDYLPCLHHGRCLTSATPPSVDESRALPSISVKRKGTVPVGRSVTTKLPNSVRR